ncbi:hypothetical protein D1AOALGA4SA_4706 [Olavius algarvensis Delta 1 endosymbiont]|nr:hypothetical protein D1AOALGA4SA_4706 [Olavius algarvensis Delta 1 endosymbiont]
MQTPFLTRSQGSENIFSGCLNGISHNLPTCAATGAAVHWINIKHTSSEVG